MTSSLIIFMMINVMSLQVTDCKFTMDHLGIDLMLQAAQNTLPGQIATAATTVGQYLATPTTGETWVNNSLPTEKLFNSVELLEGIVVCLN